MKRIAYLSPYNSTGILKAFELGGVEFSASQKRAIFASEEKRDKFRGILPAEMLALLDGLTQLDEWPDVECEAHKLLKPSAEGS